MWRLFNYLFGFEYVHISNNFSSLIRRVKILPNGGHYFEPTPSDIIKVKNPVSIDGDTINGWCVVPLTKGVTK